MLATAAPGGAGGDASTLKPAGRLPSRSPTPHASDHISALTASPSSSGSAPRGSSARSRSRRRRHHSGLPPPAAVVGSYRVGRLLGEGGFGQVRLGLHATNGTQVALKFLSKGASMSAADADRIITEVSCLADLSHPNVIRMLEVINDRDYVVIVLEYAPGGDLHDLLHKQPDGRLPENAARDYFAQIAKAVNYAHNRGVVHRDLKLENILLGTKKQCLITDFGLSQYAREGELSTASGGSLFYMPPELVRGVPSEGVAADVWCLGVILYTLLTGQLPFRSATLDAAAARLRRAHTDEARMEAARARARAQLLGRQRFASEAEETHAPECHSPPVSGMATPSPSTGAAPTMLGIRSAQSRVRVRLQSAAEPPSGNGTPPPGGAGELFADPSSTGTSGPTVSAAAALCQAAGLPPRKVPSLGTMVPKDGGAGPTSSGLVPPDGTSECAPVVALPPLSRGLVRTLSPPTKLSAGHSNAHTPSAVADNASASTRRHPPLLSADSANTTLSLDGSVGGHESWTGDFESPVRSRLQSVGRDDVSPDQCMLPLPALHHGNVQIGGGTATGSAAVDSPVPSTQHVQRNSLPPPTSGGRNSLLRRLPSGFPIPVITSGSNEPEPAQSGTADAESPALAKPDNPSPDPAAVDALAQQLLKDVSDADLVMSPRDYSRDAEAVVEIPAVVREVRASILAGQLVFPPFVSTGAEELVRSMLHSNPTCRPNASQILRHPWMRAAGSGSISLFMEELGLRTSRSIIPKFHGSSPSASPASDVDTPTAPARARALTSHAEASESMVSIVGIATPSTSRSTRSKTPSTGRRSSIDSTAHDTPRLGSQALSARSRPGTAHATRRVRTHRSVAAGRGDQPVDPATGRTAGTSGSIVRARAVSAVESDSAAAEYVGDGPDATSGPASRTRSWSSVAMLPNASSRAPSARPSRSPADPGTPGNDGPRSIVFGGAVPGASGGVVGQPARLGVHALDTTRRARLDSDHGFLTIVAPLEPGTAQPSETASPLRSPTLAFARRDTPARASPLMRGSASTPMLSPAARVLGSPVALLQPASAQAGGSAFMISTPPSARPGTVATSRSSGGSQPSRASLLPTISLGAPASELPSLREGDDATRVDCGTVERGNARSGDAASSAPYNATAGTTGRDAAAPHNASSHARGFAHEAGAGASTDGPLLNAASAAAANGSVVRSSLQRAPFPLLRSRSDPALASSAQLRSPSMQEPQQVASWTSTVSRSTTVRSDATIALAHQPLDAARNATITPAGGASDGTSRLAASDGRVATSPRHPSTPSGHPGGDVLTHDPGTATSPMASPTMAVQSLRDTVSGSDAVDVALLHAASSATSPSGHAVSPHSHSPISHASSHPSPTRELNLRGQPTSPSGAAAARRHLAQAGTAVLVRQGSGSLNPLVALADHLVTPSVRATGPGGMNADGKGALPHIAVPALQAAPVPRPALSARSHLPSPASKPLLEAFFAGPSSPASPADDALSNILMSRPLVGSAYTSAPQPLASPSSMFTQRKVPTGVAAVTGPSLFAHGDGSSASAPLAATTVLSTLQSQPNQASPAAVLLSSPTLSSPAAASPSKRAPGSVPTFAAASSVVTTALPRIAPAPASTRSRA